MSVTEDIKSRLDIVNYIGEIVPLQKAGRNYKAPCPFHNERTPSFVVFPDTQNWRCFGACGEGGDIFNFVMKREGVDFPSALRILADKAGVQLHERTVAQIDHDDYLDKLRGLLDQAANFFYERLWESPQGDAARAYVRKRGLTDETLANFRIGFAPHDWRQALEHLTSLGYTEDEIVETGVAIRNDKGNVYDRFRNRVMIPICDGRGLVVGFGARALDPDDNPKYLNSPQTPLFDKGATLFALHMARRAIRETETAVIVEGYMDAIQAHQAGFSNVVAQMGTALTDPQLKQLSTYARRLILALDPDAAGMKATMRGLDVARKVLGDASLVFNPRGIMRQASKLGVEFQVLTLPEGLDPDDLIRNDPFEWRSLVDNAQSVADYVINVGTANLTPKASFAEREQIARDLLPILMATENDLQQHYNIQRLGLKLHLDERVLIEWAERQTKRGPVLTPPPTTPTPPERPRDAKPNTAPTPTSAGPSTRSRGHAIEYYCLAMLIRQPNLLYEANRRLREIGANLPQPREEVLGALVPEDFGRSDLGMIFTTLSNALTQDDQEPLEYLKEHLPYELSEEVERLLVEQLEVFRQQLIPAMHMDLEEIKRDSEKKKGMAASIRPGGIAMQSDFEQYILELRRLRLKRENQELHFLLQEADADSQDEYNKRVMVNVKAIRVLVTAANQPAHIQHEH